MRDTDSRRLIRWWLYGLCVLIFAMIIVGGATRLTDSGLSITEWKPIVGIIPPLGEADWRDAFEKYKQIPEYRLVNQGMSLHEFKVIFWWEWAHRFLGRVIGFVFLVPFLFFWWAGHIERALFPKLVAMFALGGLQGALGWYMVSSGLTERVDVSQYRLAAHLCAAVFIFGYILWVALELRPLNLSGSPPGRGVLRSAVALVVLLFLQIGLGAFVAGIDAGLASNTWPLMGEAWIPKGLDALSPWYLNLFENPLTVQFDHRMVAYGILVWAVTHSAYVIATAVERAVSMSAVLMAALAVSQIALGVWTVLAGVPLSAALLHQGGAVILFSVALFHLHLLWRATEKPGLPPVMPAPARGRR